MRKIEKKLIPEEVFRPIYLILHRIESSPLDLITSRGGDIKEVEYLIKERKKTRNINIHGKLIT